MRTMRGVKFTHVPTECNSDDCVECLVRSKLAIGAFDAELALEQKDFNRLGFKRWFFSKVKNGTWRAGCIVCRAQYVLLRNRVRDKRLGGASPSSGTTWENGAWYTYNLCAGCVENGGLIHFERVG